MKKFSYPCPRRMPNVPWQVRWLIMKKRLRVWFAVK